LTHSCRVLGVRDATLVYRVSSAHGIARVACVRPIIDGTKEEVEEALNRAATDTSLGWPAALAKSLSAVSSEVRSQTTVVPEFVFAAVALRDRAGVVCWAGDIRLYIVVDGTLHSTTVDHTVAFAPTEELPFAENLRAAMPTMYTRTISAAARLPPAHLLFELPPGACELYICSDLAHGHLPPEEHLPHLRADQFDVLIGLQ
jgi:hypothetical protein